MKAFTDIEQSKKLAEILPIESADMWYAETYHGYVDSNGEYIVEEKPVYYLSLSKPSDSNYSQDTVKDIPAWSLAKLLSIMPSGNILINDVKSNRYKIICSLIDSEFHSNPIDACYEMILKLHELKML